MFYFPSLLNIDLLMDYSKQLEFLFLFSSRQVLPWNDSEYIFKGRVTFAYVTYLEKIIPKKKKSEYKANLYQVHFLEDKLYWRREKQKTQWPLTQSLFVSRLCGLNLSLPVSILDAERAVIGCDCQFTLFETKSNDWASLRLIVSAQGESKMIIRKPLC